MILRFKESVHVTDISPNKLFHFGKEYPILDGKVNSSMILQRALHNGSAVIVREPARPKGSPPYRQAPRGERPRYVSEPFAELQETVSRLAATLEALVAKQAGLHNPFVEAEGKTLSHPEDAQGSTQARLTQLQETLDAVVARLGALEMAGQRGSTPKVKKATSGETPKRSDV